MKLFAHQLAAALAVALAASPLSRAGERSRSLDGEASCSSMESCLESTSYDNLCSDPVHCGEQVCEDCFATEYGCEPTWTFRAGAIFLNRDKPSGGPIATRTNGGETLFSAADFDFDTGAGYDLYARRRFASGRSLEMRYFEIDDFSAAVNTPNAGLINIGGVNVGGASLINSNYNSRIRNAEINLVGSTGRWWNPIVGFRYVSLDDDLRNGFGAGGPSLLSYDVRTENDLYGGQLGAEGALMQRGRFSVDASGKAGVYYNDIDRSTGFFPPVGNPIFPSSASGDTTAFVGDMAINANYYLTKHLALRGGYQLLWLTDVAEASNQGAAFGGSALDNDGHPFYHGAMAAVEVTW